MCKRRRYFELDMEMDETPGGATISSIGRANLDSSRFFSIAEQQVRDTKRESITNPHGTANEGDLLAPEEARKSADNFIANVEGKTEVKCIFDKFSTSELTRILDSVKEMSSMEFGCNNFGDAGVAVFAEKLEVIEHLSLWGNSITDCGIVSVSKIVRNCPLKTLVLSNNDISDNGIIRLADSLMMSETLTGLDLSVNSSITDRGIRGLVRCLKDRNVPLERLNLSNDSIADEGARALAEWLSMGKCPIVMVDLSYNVVEDEGASALADALAVNETLQELNMAGNLLSGVGASRLRSNAEGKRAILIEDHPV